MPKLFGSYPFGSDKQKVQDLPDPGGSGGGSDEQLAEAADALSPDTADTYAPPVPPTTYTGRRNRELGERGLDNRLILTAGDARTQRNFGFRLYTALVDNWTDQWVFWHGAQRWVPPQTGGVVMRGDGNVIADVEFLAPPGITQPGSTAGQQAVFTFFEEQTSFAVT